jgi:hypothetical protein
VSRHSYGTGSTIGPIPQNETNHFTSDYQPGSAKERTEEILEKNRPANVIPRRRCIYLFKSFAQCIHYGDSQHCDHDYIIYKVEAIPSRGMPMALVERVRKHIENGEECKANTIAREYWSPTQEWRYLEFLCESCTVRQSFARNAVEYDFVSIPRESLHHIADLEAHIESASDYPLR